MGLELSVRLCIHHQVLLDLLPHARVSLLDNCIHHASQHARSCDSTTCTTAPFQQFLLACAEMLFVCSCRYDSYRIPAADWASLLKPNGAHTVRGTALDGGYQEHVAMSIDGLMHATCSPDASLCTEVWTVARDPQASVALKPSAHAYTSCWL